MKKANDKHIEVIEGYRHIWKHASNHRTLKENKSALANTISAARKYQSFSGIEDLIREFLKTDPTNHQKIISLGCGTAKDLAEIKSIFPSSVLFGVDTSREVLLIAKEKFGTANINLICASMSNLPFQKSLRFDMLVAGQSLDLDFEEKYLLKLLKEATRYSSAKSRFYLTFYGTSETQLELYKCTPIGNALDKLGWTTFYGVRYHIKKKGLFAQGVFWVEIRSTRASVRKK